MSGQSSATPFMKVNNEHNYSATNSCKKGVTFDAMDTTERKSDSIDKLTSCSKQNEYEMDKHEMQYMPQVYQGRNKGQSGIDKTITRLEIDHTVETEVNHIEAEEIIIETINQIIEVDHETMLDMMIEETTIDMMIGEIATDKMTDMTIIGQEYRRDNYKTTVGQIMEETIREQIYRTRSKSRKI